MRITVIGAGSMGHGIAQVSAAAGHDVTLNDVDQERVQAGLDSIEGNLTEGVERGKVSEDERTATLENVDGSADFQAAVEGSDFVIEAVPEDIELKKDVLTDAEEFIDETAVIGSNTSSLSVTELASALDSSNRVIGVHFFNPPHIMSLVEVIVAEQTDERTEQITVDYVENIGKNPVVVRDTAGFSSSRLGLVLGLEAMRMVETGVASVTDIDTSMREGYNHPMGPLKLTDVVGLDVRLDIAEYLTDELGERFRPPQILRRKVRAGNLGKKSGEGFYIWEDGEAVRPAKEDR
ncbi:3-hydroxybutyryl-CoA dehydrogenase [Halorubrum sp. C3]|nr:3-hydroxybutyryl-CoA dehydrogenase [Halorubrum sp. C3]